MPATLLVPKNTPKWLTDRTAGSRPCYRLPSKWVYTYTVRFTSVIFSDTFCDPFIVTYLKAILILLKLWNFYIYWYCIFVHTQMIYLNCFCVCGGLDFITCSTFLDCICILYSSESYCTPYNLQTWILWFLNLESKFMNEQYLLLCKCSKYN